MRLSRLFSLVALGGLSACATIISGTNQNVAVDSSPEGADCRVLQGGLTVGEVPSTPGYVHVRKSGAPLELACSKPGYKPAASYQTAGFNGWVIGNVVVGGVIGVVVDLASGALHTYNSSMVVALGGNGVYQPSIASFPSGYGTAYADNSANLASAQSLDSQRFYAATGQTLPVQHGLIRLPPATPGGDYTYIWPTSPDQQ